MALSKNFNRPKLNATLSESASMSADVADGADGNSFVIDITTDVIRDDTTTVTKTLCRIVVPISILGVQAEFSGNFYVFPGNAANYVAGGTTPALSAGTAGKTVDLDAFFTAAGDTRKNT